MTNECSIRIGSVLNETEDCGMRFGTRWRRRRLEGAKKNQRNLKAPSKNGEVSAQASRGICRSLEEICVEQSWGKIEPSRCESGIGREGRDTSEWVW